LEAEEWFSNLIIIGLMVLGFALLQACAMLIPEPYGRYVGSALFLAVTIGGIFFATFYAQIKASPYPYLELIVRPDNKKLHCFVEKDLSYQRHLGNGFYESHLKLAVPVKFKDYGKVKEIILLHRGRLSERVNLRPGTAVWYGLFISHPATDIVEVVQAKTATTTIDHGEPVPVFYLVMGGRSKYSEVPTPLLKVANVADGGDAPSAEVIEALRARVQELEMENAKLRRDALEYQQRALALEEINVQKTAETAGLLEAKVGIKEHAYEVFLGLYNAFGRFDKALEALKGRRFGLTFGKWMAITIIALAFIGLLWARPDIAHAFAVWLSNPLNALIFVIALVVIAVIALGAKKGRK